MLIDDISELCRKCGLIDDPSKTTNQLEIKTIEPGWKWSESKFNSGDFGFSFCLTERHMPEKYYDKGGNQVVYIDMHKENGENPFIRGMWLYLPTITHSGHLRFMQRVIKNEIYREDLILDGIGESFIPFNDTLESYIPEVSMEGAEPMVLELVKKYLTNVRNVCKSLN